MPEDKPIGSHALTQAIETSIADGKLEIIFQMVIDNQGNTSITVFKSLHEVASGIVKEANANSGGNTGGNAGGSADDKPKTGK
jgi:hypothetical protein